MRWADITSSDSGFSFNTKNKTVPPPPAHLSSGSLDVAPDASCSTYQLPSDHLREFENSKSGLNKYFKTATRLDKDRLDGVQPTTALRQSPTSSPTETSGFTGLLSRQAQSARLSSPSPEPHPPPRQPSPPPPKDAAPAPPTGPSPSVSSGSDIRVGTITPIEEKEEEEVEVVEVQSPRPRRMKRSLRADEPERDYNNSYSLSHAEDFEASPDPPMPPPVQTIQTPPAVAPLLLNPCKKSRSHSAVSAAPQSIPRPSNRPPLRAPPSFSGFLSSRPPWAPPPFYPLAGRSHRKPRGGHPNRGYAAGEMPPAFARPANGETTPWGSPSAPTPVEGMPSNVSEADQRRIDGRRKDIAIGKATGGYRKFLTLRESGECVSDYPGTPNPYDLRMSNSLFRSRLAVWRQALHKYDDAEEK
eukprot:GHVS01082527.1.p1 GENE.GHVS01082527.1~~GHVS01082527.1.p1  ORF type:complete len:415 (-),score=55.87 GHVS01082527.1:1351-2595(-)